MGDLTKGDVFIAQVEAMAKLVVTPGIEAMSLLVDAEALMTDPLGVRYWRLYPIDSEGVWSCAGAGERGPLSEVLRGIANAYIDRDALTEETDRG